MDELNKSQWYEVEHVEEIEDFEPDQYNNRWYNVKFRGVAETAMWLAKEEPEVKKYYGHLETTKSGKRIRFKRDQEPEDDQKPAGAKSQSKPDAFLRDATTVPIDMIRALLPYFDVQSLEPNSSQYKTLMELAQNLTEDALTMVEAVRKGESLKAAPVDKSLLEE